MKLKLIYLAALAYTISSVNIAQAAVYTIDFDAVTERQSASGVFTTDTFSAIDAASIDFLIRGKTTYTNSRGYSWYYSPNIDLSINGTQALDNYALGGDFSLLRLDLDASARNNIITNQSIDFTILAQSGFWYSDLSPWGGYTNTPFYLDNVSLNVTPSAVPLPAAVWLFGAGVVGLVGASRRRKSAD